MSRIKRWAAAPGVNLNAAPFSVAEQDLQVLLQPSRQMNGCSPPNEPSSPDRCQFP